MRRRGLFEPSYVEKLLQQHESCVADHSTLLWGLVGIEVWQRLFLDAGSNLNVQANHDLSGSHGFPVQVSDIPVHAEIGTAAGL